MPLARVVLALPNSFYPANYLIRELGNIFTNRRKKGEKKLMSSTLLGFRSSCTLTAT